MPSHRAPIGATLHRVPQRWLALTILALLFAGCGGADSSSPGATADSSGESSNATSAGVDVPDDAPLGLQQAPAGASPAIVYGSPTSVSANLPSGTVVVEDDAGDVRGPDSAPDVTLPPGLDLSGASLESDGSRLMATWSLPASAPRRLDDGSTLTWIMHIWQDGALSYQLVVQLAGADWSIYVEDVTTGDEIHFRLASLYADRVEAPFPASSLSRLTGSFTWLAEVTWTTPDGTTWFDRAPVEPMQFPSPS